MERINTSIRSQTVLNQWRNSASVIEWFKNISNKANHTFVIFDIDNFYPSITESLLKKAIEFAKNFTEIPQKDMNIIMHARKSLLFDGDTELKVFIQVLSANMQALVYLSVTKAKRACRHIYN